LKGNFEGTDTSDQGFDYNYKQGGKDWPDLKSKYGVPNNCGKAGNQSPINLLQPIWSYGWAYGDTIPKQNDAHETTYKNLRKGVQVAWPKNINTL
jgi:carbonic anhydrase